MIVHVEPSLLRKGFAESDALLAVLGVYESSPEDLSSFGQLLDGLQGSPSLDLVLEANRYGDDLGFSGDEARTEIQGALIKLDVFKRGAELDSIRTKGMQSKDDQVVFLQKLVDFKRLQGALRFENRNQP
jgi:hypothetical protein